MKKLYCLGTGPGDPALLTLKAVEILQRSDRVFVVRNQGKTIAFDVVKSHVSHDKIHYLEVPMGHVRAEDYKKNLRTIAETLQPGEEGVFPVLGDGTICSTFFQTLTNHASLDMEIECIPGIPSFLAAANKALHPLMAKGEIFALVEGNRPLEKELLEQVDSLAILKTTGDKRNLLNQLDEAGFQYVYVARLGLDGEVVFHHRKDIEKEDTYLSLMLCRKE